MVVTPVLRLCIGLTLSRIVSAVISASGRASLAGLLVAHGAALKDMSVVCEVELGEKVKVLANGMKCKWNETITTRSTVRTMSNKAMGALNSDAMSV